MTKFILTGDQFLAIAEHVVPCASPSDELSPVLNSIHFEIWKGAVTVLGTDGSRLAVFKDETSKDFPMPAVLHDEQQTVIVKVNIPKAALLDVRKVGTKRLRSALITFSIQDKERYHISVFDYSRKAKTDQVPQEFSGELVASDYPDCSQLMPVDFKYEMTISTRNSWTSEGKKTELDFAVEHITRINRAYDTQSSHTVKLKIKNGKDKSNQSIGVLDFSMLSPYFTYKGDPVELSEQFKNSGSPDPELDIAFSCGYLADALNHNQPVTMHANTGNKPVVFTYSAEPRVKHLLMPVQCK